MSLERRAGAGRRARRADAGAAAGRMLSVRLPAAELAAAAAVDDRRLAAENGPALCVVAGPTPDDRGARSGRSRPTASPRAGWSTSHAFHSAMMDPVVEPMAAAPAGHRAAGAAHPDPLHGERGLARRRAGPRPALLGHAPARAGALRAGGRAAARRSGAPAARDRPARDAVDARAPGDRRTARAPGGGAEPGRRAGSGAAAIASALGQLWSLGVAVDWAALCRARIAAPRRRCRAIPSSASGTGSMRRRPRRQSMRAAAPAVAARWRHRDAAGARGGCGDAPRRSPAATTCWRACARWSRTCPASKSARRRRRHAVARTRPRLARADPARAAAAARLRRQGHLPPADGAVPVDGQPGRDAAGGSARRRRRPHAAAAAGRRRRPVAASGAGRRARGRRAAAAARCATTSRRPSARSRASTPAPTAHAAPARAPRRVHRALHRAHARAPRPTPPSTAATWPIRAWSTASAR